MTRAAKITYLVMVILGLTSGVAIGFWKAALKLKSNYDISRSLAPGVLDSFSYAQYRHADVQHAEVGLVSVAGLLLELENLHPERTQRLNLANTYTRLALLRDSLNDATGSDQYMTQALRWYAATGSPRRTVFEMKAAVIQLDHRIDELKSK
jgi:hypothetical protein